MSAETTLGTGKRNRLSGTVALVTGGTSGIGRAIAIGFAEEGARVVIAGRSVERGTEVVRGITTAGGDAAFVKGDVSAPADSQNWVNAVVERFGKLDILVNSAGVFPLGRSHKVSEAEFDQAVAANLKGVFFCTQAAIRHMLERGEGGKIINISSIAGLVGIPGGAVCSLTKGALIALAKSWAVEYAPHGILVNALAPGNVETPMNEALLANPRYMARMIENTPLGRNGQTGDIVPAAILLASNDGNYFCGTTVVIDGGWVAR